MVEKDDGIIKFVGDSGCSSNLVRQRELLHDFKHCEKIMKVGKREVEVRSIGTGTVYAHCTDIDGNKRLLCFTNVLCMPDAMADLLSEPYMMEKGVSFYKQGKTSTTPVSVTMVTPAPDKTVFRLTKNKHKLQILTGQVVWPAEELPSKHISLIGTTGGEQTLRKEAVDGKSDVKKVTNKVTWRVPLTNTMSWKEWHLKCGHAKDDIMRKTASRYNIELTGEKVTDCHVCNLTKSKMSRPKALTTPPLKPGELTLFDMWGPYDKPAYGGMNYGTAFVDNGSSRVTGFASKQKKNHLPTCIDIYSVDVLGAVGLKAERIRCDRAGENRAPLVLQTIRKHQGRIEHNAPRKSEQMGQVEVIIHICKMIGDALRLTAGLEDYHVLFFFAILHAMWIYNHTAHWRPRERKWAIPEEIFTGKKLTITVQDAPIWGSLIYYKEPKKKLLTTKASVGLFMGFPSTKTTDQTIRVWNIKTKKLIETDTWKSSPTKFLRDLPTPIDFDGKRLNALDLIDEMDDYFFTEVAEAIATPAVMREEKIHEDVEINDEDDIAEAKEGDTFQGLDIKHLSAIEKVDMYEFYKTGESYTDWSGASNQLEIKRIVTECWTNDVENDIPVPLSAITTRRSRGRAPARLIEEDEDSDMALLSFIPAEEEWGYMLINDGSGKGEVPVSPEPEWKHRVQVLPTMDSPTDDGWVPHDVTEAMNSHDPRWTEATKKEMEPHDKETVEIVDKPTNGETILGSRALYSIKSSGLAKMRWVVTGFQQIRGKDFKDCSSPVLAWTTLLLVISIAVFMGMDIRSVDAVQAFVQADIDTDVYLHPLKGYHHLPPGKCFRLKKALYGLHQSSLLWYLLVSGWIIRQGFTQTKSDPCLFFKWFGGVLFLVCLYVDDLLLLCTDTKIILRFIAAFCARFKATSDRDNKPSEYLGAEFEYLKDGGIKITHLKSAQKMFAELKLKYRELKTVAAPAECSRLKPFAGPNQFSDLTEEEKDEYDPRISYAQAEQYQGAVGSLIYLSTRSRPELANPVRELSRFTASPRKSHRKALIHTLRWIANSMDKGIEFHPRHEDEMVLRFWVDASFGDATIHGGSCTGFCGQLGGPWTWGSTLQKHKVSGSGEAEIDAVHDGALELLWAVGLCKELRLHPKVIIYQDNTQAEGFLRTGKVSNKTKHISQRYHRSVDLIAVHKWIVERCETDRMIADVMTKNLSGVKVNTLLPMIRGEADRVSLYGEKK